PPGRDGPHRWAFQAFPHRLRGVSDAAVHDDRTGDNHVAKATSRPRPSPRIDLGDCATRVLSAKSWARDAGIQESMPSSGGFLDCCRGITNQVWIVFEQGTLRGEPFMRFSLVLLGACD